MKMLDDSTINHHTETSTQKADIQWVQDRGWVILVDEGHQRTARLEGDDALLWGWLNAGLLPDKCARLLGAVKNIPPDKAGRQIEECIKRWQEAGWLGDSRGTDE